VLFVYLSMPPLKIIFPSPKPSAKALPADNIPAFIVMSPLKFCSLPVRLSSPEPDLTNDIVPLASSCRYPLKVVVDVPVIVNIAFDAEEFLTVELPSNDSHD